MDSLVAHGILAVAVFYLVIAAGAAIIVYGAYLLFTAVLTGNINSVVNLAVIIGILASAYGCIGVVLAHLQVI